MINSQNICSPTLCNGRGKDVKEGHRCSFVSLILVHPVTRPREFFFFLILKCPLKTQNSWPLGCHLQGGQPFVFLLGWLPQLDTIIRINYGFISYKVQPLLMVYSAFLGQCMRQFRFLCSRQKINSCKRNRRRFSRHDFLEVILPTYSRPQCGQNV